MRFLVDHQMPAALARFLESKGHFARHVRELQLHESDDFVIWQHAIANEMVIISKDEDFYFLATIPGTKGKLVWVRIGNCRKRVLLEAFELRLPKILEALGANSPVVELL